MTEQDTPSDWYVFGAHTRRAIGYVGAALAERGDLPVDFEQPQLLDLWGEALQATMDGAERSPIHASEGVTERGLIEVEEMARIRNYLNAWAWTVGTETPEGVPLAKQLLAHVDALQARVAALTQVAEALTTELPMIEHAYYSGEPDALDRCEVSFATLESALSALDEQEPDGRAISRRCAACSGDPEAIDKHLDGCAGDPLAEHQPMTQPQNPEPEGSANKEET